MSNLSVFTFEHQQVRFVGTPEKPEWIAVDLCKILEIKNPSDTLAKFSEEERGVATIYSAIRFSETKLYQSAWGIESLL